MTSRSKGNYYEQKSVEYLKKMGYVCEKAYARVVWIGGKPRSIHHDFFGCIDIIGVKKDSVCFVQVKFGKHNLSSARKKLGEFKAPAKYIHVWGKGAKMPYVEVVL